jgi:hypothetical protein
VLEEEELWAALEAPPPWRIPHRREGPLLHRAVELRAASAGEARPTAGARVALLPKLLPPPPWEFTWEFAGAGRLGRAAAPLGRRSRGRRQGDAEDAPRVPVLLCLLVCAREAPAAAWCCDRAPSAHGGESTVGGWWGGAERIETGWGGEGGGDKKICVGPVVG